MPITTPSALALTWNLNNVQFQDGATASGSFDYSGAGNGYSNINFTVNGPIFGSAFTFTSANSTLSPRNSPTLLRVASPTFSQNNNFLGLQFSSSLTNSGGTIALVPSSDTGYGLYANSTSQLSGGSVTTESQAIPWNIEPGQGVVL